MAVRVTVGDAFSGGDSDTVRGAVTVAPARTSMSPGRPVLIEVVTAAGSRHGVQLTIGEAEVLQAALDSMIFEAAMRNSDGSSSRAASYS